MLKFGLEIDFDVVQKCYGAIFEISIFRDFSGGQSSNFCHFDKILDFDPVKNPEKQTFKNRRITFLYHPKIYIQLKFQHQRTCRFLDPSRYMYKLTIFSIKCIFPYSWRHPLHINDHKIKSNDIWVKYDPILERGKIGLYQNKEKHIFRGGPTLYP